MFPLLEELEIGVTRQCYLIVRHELYTPKIWLHLEGGLCLLGRLNYLQRLKVLWNGRPLARCNYSKEDLNWMVPSGRTKKFRNMRQMRVQLWQQQRFREDRLEGLRQAQQKLQQQQQATITSADTADLGGSYDTESEALLLRQLQNLGLLREVEEVVKEIGLGSLQPLPCLEGLSISNPYFGRPEDEI